MKIYWKNKKIEEAYQKKQYSQKLGLDKKEARNLSEIIDILHKAKNLHALPTRLNCHPIKEGKKFLHYTIDIPNLGGGRGDKRILVKPVGDFDFADLKTITDIYIIGIEEH